MNSDSDVRSERQLEPTAQGAELQQLGRAEAPSRHRVTDDEDSIDLREYWNILVRRRSSVGMVLAVTVLFALVVTLLSTKIYQAATLVQIEREEGKVLEYQDWTAEESDISRDFYQTQYEIIKSRSLARQVIDQLDLRTEGTFSALNTPSLLGKIKGVVKGWIKEDDAAEEEEEQDIDIESVFLENVVLKPVKNSRLVRILYESPDPEEAANIANALAETFIKANLDRRYKASSYAKTFLEKQTLQIRANLEDSEQRLADYARERGIIDLKDKLAILMQRFTEMNTELVEVEAQRILAEVEYQDMLKNGSASTVSVLESPVIQYLKESKATLEAEYRELGEVYKPGYPKMLQLKEQIAELDREIADESEIIASSIKNEFEVMVRAEAMIWMRLEEIKEEILTLQDSSIDYQALSREVETNRELYDGLLQRMKEVGITAGIGTNNISVIDPAEVPRFPYKPSLVMNLAIAIVFGLFGGIVLAFLSESMDDTVKSSEQIEKLVGAPMLGVIPRVSTSTLHKKAQSLALLAHQDPKSALAEAFRSMRTSLIFSTSEGAPGVLHFTSSNPSEGKTSSSVNTAITFAQTGNKVLLVDADLRNPSLHKVFSFPNTEGLTNYLTSNIEPTQIARATNIDHLFVVTSGPISPNPVELIASGKMAEFLDLAKEKFDYVIIDGPPVIGLADALVLGNLARATLFVIEAGSTRSGALSASIKRLAGANTRIVGCILAKVGSVGSGHGYDYHYSYSYNYGVTDEQVAALPKQAAS